MTRVLLITGARSLADDPAAEAWARGLIAEALAGVDLLIAGDAPGPDAWASDGAISNPDGPFVRVYRTHGADAGWITEGGRGGDRRERWAASDAHPLRRNIVMVNDAKDMWERGEDVRCLALLDGRKPAVVPPGEKRPTRGTEHTARLARDAGLMVTDRVWPRDAAKGWT